MAKGATVVFKNAGKPSTTRPSGMPAVEKAILYKAVRDNCRECMGGDAGNLVTREIKNCTAGPDNGVPVCKFWAIRPYQTERIRKREAKAEEKAQLEKLEVKQD